MKTRRNVIGQSKTRIHYISIRIDGGDPILLRHLDYTTETHTACKGNREIIIENMNPILNEQEQILQHQTIEQELFEIFIKYQKNNHKRIAI